MSKLVFNLSDWSKVARLYGLNSPFDARQVVYSLLADRSATAAIELNGEQKVDRKFALSGKQKERKKETLFVHLTYGLI